MMTSIMKRAFITFACLSMGIPGAFAETGDSAMGMKLVGEINAIYKMQTDYRTPLDSNDPLIADGFDNRDGANNRSSQNVRSTGSLTMIAKGQENKTANGNKWYGLIGVAKVKFDAQDPDYVSDEKLDGAYRDKVDLGDVWLRYAPSRAVGIKIGVQTVAATANAVGIGHTFAGDADEDFTYYTAAVLNTKPGITVDIHLSKNIEFGIGQLQGQGDLSSFVAGGSSAAANNTVAWFKGGFGLVDLTVGYQSVAVGGTETDGDGIEGKYKHTVLNWAAKFNVGQFSPFIGQQTISGDKTSAGATFESYDAAMQSLAALGAERLNNKGGERAAELSLTTVGLSAGLGSKGRIVAAYTSSATPEWGEAGNAAIASEFSSTTQINYVYPISKKASLTVFYNALSIKEDSNLRDDVETATDNNAKIDTAATMNAITAAQAASLKSLSDTLDIYKWSSTSMGVALNVKF